MTKNLYRIANLPDGQRLLYPYKIADVERMWKELSANDVRNEDIREARNGPDHGTGESVNRLPGGTRGDQRGDPPYGE
ncbi:MAG: hypothetical protein WBA46_09450 [Thermomicrobiales bacterium]